jgi:hypothetical protein
MTGINRPENLFEGVRPTVYGENLRDFPEPAGEVERRTSSGARRAAHVERRTSSGARRG